jgi:hypothetical protein
VVAVDKAVHVAGGADHHRGDDRADSEQLGRRGPRGGHDLGKSLLRRSQLLVQATQVPEQLEGELVAGELHRVGGLVLIEDRLDLGGVHLACKAAGHELGQMRPRRACLVADLGDHTSFEPRHGETRRAGSSFGSQALRSADGVRANPAGSLDATTESPRLGGFSTRR